MCVGTNKNYFEEIDIEQIYVLTWKHINNIGSHNFELNAKIIENVIKFNPNSKKTKHLLIKKKQKQKEF